MPKFELAPYRGAEHGSFQQEWGLHRGCSDWWYATGYLNDEAGHLYSFQFTVFRVKAYLIYPYVVMLSLTDFAADKHYFFHDFQLHAQGIVIEPNTIAFRNLVRIRKGQDAMTLAVRHKHFSLDLELDYGKGAVWHCDDGLLQMGIPHKKETTIYYSYPNMQTSGTMTLNDDTRSVSGKAWFDRQSGPYSMFKTSTHWEWFSLRFFDDEEMMLFSFPQTGHQDGTYIDKHGQSTRLTDYTLTPKDFMMSPEPLRYSSQWELSIPGFKEEHYTIHPLSHQQFNLNYYELLAAIHNRNNERVGMCFVELLPGARNKRYSITI